LSDLTLEKLALRLCALVLIAGVHGLAVAGAACALGDPGPRYDGRLRANPIVHVDLLGLLSGVLFMVGWSKPIAIDPMELRAGRAGLVLVVVAAAAATLATVQVARFARPWILPLLGDTSSVVAFALIETIGELGTWFALINLVPVPPLTGSRLLVALAPQVRGFVQRSQLYGGLALLGLSATGVITGALAPAYRMLARLVLGE
jgi:Zn-dependent protease